MSARSYSFLGRLTILGAVFTLGTPGLSQQPPPVQPNPAAPQLNLPFPAGMQRGTTLDLALTGARLANPTGLWTSIPNAKVTIPTESNNGKDAARLLVRLEVPKETPLGFYSLRLATTAGVSNLRLFCIDDLPQVVETNNRTKATAQAVTTPVVVAGRVDAETSDYYKVSVAAGQRLHFEILGHRLGSPFDPQITLFDAKTERELPAGHSNDAPGLQTDPRLTYTFKDAGDYLVEVRDVLFRGGPDFCYRLRIGDFPCATTPIPMAGKRGSKVTVHFAGPSVEGVAPVEVDVPADPQVTVVWVTPRGANGLLGWPVALAVTDLDEVVEQEPNNEPAKATRISAPGGVTGRFQDKGDIDHFVFTAKKGQRLIIEAQTQELYSPTEVYIVLKNAMGAEVAKTNPAQAPRLDFNPPADGDFTLVVEHLLYWGGPGESYRLSLTPYEPGFDLTLPLDRYDIPQGASAAVNIMAVRRDYTGPIEVSVLGNPGITGQVVIKPGQPTAANLPAALLLLNATTDLPMGPYPITVQGRATINGKVVVRNASVRGVVSQNLGVLVYPPLQVLHEVAVAVTEKPPFTLVAKFDLPEALRGSSAPLTITATRVPGFDDEIVLAALGLPQNVTAALKNIPKGKNEIKVELKAAANAALGTSIVSFTGKTKFQGKDFTVTALPVPLVLSVPFELQVEPKPLPVAPGAKTKIKVTAVRKGGYQGPISLEFRNLPTNVTAPKATIAMGQDVGEIEITAGANAAEGDKADVNVLGIATAAGNQQGASPNFTVSVKKAAP